MGKTSSEHAFYELSPFEPSMDDDLPSHYTLWQSGSGDLSSFSYTSLDEAVEAAQWFRAIGLPRGTLVDASELEVVDEAVYVRVAPEDMISTCDEGAYVEIRSLDDGAPSGEATAAGTWGDFYRSDSGWSEGFVYRSETAEANFEGYDCRGPAPAAYLEERLEDLVAELRISWSGGSR
jgi:hypothetical protein